MERNFGRSKSSSISSIQKRVVSPYSSPNISRVYQSPDPSLAFDSKRYVSPSNSLNISRKEESFCSTVSHNMCQNCLERQSKDFFYAKILHEIILNIENNLLTIEAWKQSRTVNLQLTPLKINSKEPDYGLRKLEEMSSKMNFEIEQLANSVKRLSKTNVWKYTSVDRPSESKNTPIEAVKHAKIQLNKLKDICIDNYAPELSNNEIANALSLMIRECKRDKNA